mmetsp:Transcript_8905/g.20326  ORF Transcript_8905/g.20326 Transcript_8905/m.20326 type:complete len:298 (+) Transcript_8905:1822-2715(+)
MPSSSAVYISLLFLLSFTPRRRRKKACSGTIASSSSDRVSTRKSSISSLSKNPPWSCASYVSSAPLSLPARDLPVVEPGVFLFVFMPLKTSLRTSSSWAVDKHQTNSFSSPIALPSGHWHPCSSWNRRGGIIGSSRKRSSAASIKSLSLSDCLAKASTSSSVSLNSSSNALISCLLVHFSSPRSIIPTRARFFASNIMTKCLVVLRSPHRCSILAGAFRLNCVECSLRTLLEASKTLSSALSAASFHPSSDVCTMFVLCLLFLRCVLEIKKFNMALHAWGGLRETLLVRSMKPSRFF